MYLRHSSIAMVIIIPGIQNWQHHQDCMNASIRHVDL